MVGIAPPPPAHVLGGERRVAGVGHRGSAAVGDQGVNPAGEPVAAAEIGELDQEDSADDVSAEAGDEVAERLGGPAGREEVVVDEDAGAGEDGVGVDLEGSRRILEVIGLADRLAGQAAGFAGGDEAGRRGGRREPVRA